jgi:hypothetical protein
MKWITSIDLAVSVESKKKNKTHYKSPCLVKRQVMMIWEKGNTAIQLSSFDRHSVEVNGRPNVPAALSLLPVG